MCFVRRLIFAVIVYDYVQYCRSLNCCIKSEYFNRHRSLNSKPNGIGEKKSSVKTFGWSSLYCILYTIVHDVLVSACTLPQCIRRRRRRRYCYYAQ